MFLGNVLSLYLFLSLCGLAPKQVALCDMSAPVYSSWHHGRHYRILV